MKAVLGRMTLKKRPPHLEMKAVSGRMTLKKIS
jgi:hypothetical protein